jgi:hypothetical protein
MANIPKLVKSIGNELSTTLAGGISASATTITVVSAAGFNPSGGYIIIDEGVAGKEEVVYVESVAGNVLTVATNGRGVEGTVATAHDAGASVTDILVQSHINSPISAFALEHNDDGTHKLTIDPVRTPGTAGLQNGKISVTVASNNLSVAVKTLAGADPSATNPVYIVLDDQVRSITSALSVTANAGTSWFASGNSNFATFERDYFVYIGYNSTDGVTLGFSPIPYAHVYSDFSTSTTNVRYARISDITNAASNDIYRVVGRFAATLSASPHNWSVPTFNAKNLVQYPIYETRRLSYDPGFTGFSSTTVKIGRYTINYNILDLLVVCTGTSNSTTFTCVSPYSRVALSSGVAYGAIRGENNGSTGTSPRMWQMDAGSSTITFFSDYGGSLWTASGTKSVQGVYIRHEID